MFSLRDEQGTPVFTGLSFPEVVARLWGESFPDNIRKVNVEAWLLALTMTDGKGFGPYHYNKAMKTAILDMAVQMYGLLPHPVDRLPVAEAFIPSTPAAIMRQPLTPFLFKEILQSARNVRAVLDESKERKKPVWQGYRDREFRWYQRRYGSFSRGSVIQSFQYIE